MKPDIENGEQEADAIREKYNPDGLSPFPHEKIIEDHPELKISFFDMEEDNVSGAILFNIERKIFHIFINSLKPKSRQHFTLAHELGHFFLHKESIKTEEIMIDGEKSLDGGKILFLLDEEKSTCLEIEANHFATNLIMPASLVVEAWERLKKIEDCAEVFNVSVIAMTMRLEKLGLIKEE